MLRKSSKVSSVFLGSDLQIHVFKQEDYKTKTTGQQGWMCYRYLHALRVSGSAGLCTFIYAFWGGMGTA